MKIQFNQTHMTELENMFNVTSEQREGFDILSSEVADILNTFRFAMEEGEEGIISVNHDTDTINRTLNFVHNYCRTRNIAYNVMMENDMYMLYL